MDEDSGLFTRSVRENAVTSPAEPAELSEFSLMRICDKAGLDTKRIARELKKNAGVSSDSSDDEDPNATIVPRPHFRSKSPWPRGRSRGGGVSFEDRERDVSFFIKFIFKK